MKKRNKDFIPDFLQIPSLVMHMNPADRFVFGAIYNYCNMSLGRCTASNLAISKIARISVQSVANSLTRLEEENLIKRVYTDDTKKTRKEIICLISLKKVDYSVKESSLPDRVITDSSTDEQSIILENKKDTIPVPELKEFNSEEYLRALTNAKQRHIVIGAVFALRKKKQNEFKTKRDCDNFIYGRNSKVASRLSKYTDQQILKAMKESELLSEFDSKFKWGLETVEKVLSK